MAHFVLVDVDVSRVRCFIRGARELSGLVSTDGRLIGWETSARGAMDKTDCRTSGNRLHFTLFVDGVAVHPSQICLGATAVHLRHQVWIVAAGRT